MYTKHQWKHEVYYNFHYVKYLPKDYDKNKKYPLVVFLHGAGERGDDLELVCKHGFMKHVRESGKECWLVWTISARPCPSIKSECTSPA